uniref:Uncharacterized protein n=1 Tax=uncultured prokaryote TaxID=198431 RepID=A0A0H5Q5X2_9ZZZZ|nr:hypothetical protein [uncultured prokaryote]
MALLDVQVIQPSADALPENFVTNIWHFDDDNNPAEWVNIKDRLVTFYTSITGLFSSLVAQNGVQIKMYRVSDPVPRAPVYTFTFNHVAVPSGAPCPPEIAMVMSYKAASVSGIPVARLRGRVYIGPLDIAAIDATGRLTGTVQVSLRNAGSALVAASIASSTWKWSTHSKVLGSGSEVVSGFVDNEPDTQRRRGRTATNRSTF